MSTQTVVTEVTFRVSNQWFFDMMVDFADKTGCSWKLRTKETLFTRKNYMTLQAHDRVSHRALTKFAELMGI